MTEEPQLNRRIRRTVTSTSVPTSAPARITVLSDLQALQRERYATWPYNAAQYAIARDAELSLWSSAHRYEPLPGRYDLPSDEIVMSDWQRDYKHLFTLYAYSDLRLVDMAALTGIPLRSLESTSSRYGWRESRVTYRRIREAEEAEIRTSTLESAAKEDAVRGALLDSGMELLAHAQSALARHSGDIKPRDIPLMLQTALKLVGAGAAMPTEYRHSVVDNPSANPTAPTVNVLNIATQADADALLRELGERVKALPSTVTVSANGSD